MIQSKVPRVAFLCPECENIELMLDGIQKACDQVNLQLKCHDLIVKVACNPIQSFVLKASVKIVEK